ncbi:MAG: PAS domain S-box protein [Bacteroidetes bacterium]|nr:MAG: PAS domain S-box protein [Bacteroidota bacterium]TAG92491.1 MAG: PAS domain S-box protein [Bacteroidota bacterium]
MKKSTIQARLNNFIISSVVFTTIGLVFGLFSWFNALDPIPYFLLIIIGVGNFLVQYTLWQTLLIYIDKPLHQLNKITEAIIEGDLEVQMNIPVEFEIESITKNTLVLANSIKKARDFSQKIGKGDYDIDDLTTDNTLITNEDTLFGSLQQMKNQLQSLSEAERKENWITMGMANFTEILRSDDIDLHHLSQKIINNLVEYLHACNGGVYVLNENQNQEQHLELVATYSYPQDQKYHQKIIIKDNFGEGLVGQTFLEKTTLHLTNVPMDYVKISSGLGEAIPNTILIVPLQLNGKMEGIVELTAFKPFEKYQITFVEKISENIASAILSIKVNEHTKKLLQESQELTQKLQVQEEEMRQNYEELRATQEMIERKNSLIETQKEAIEKALAEQTQKSELLLIQEKQMQQNMEMLVLTQEQMTIAQTELDGQLNAINSSTIAKIEFDLSGIIISANDSFCDMVKCEITKLKGQNHERFLDERHLKNNGYEKFWNKLKNGKPQYGEYCFVDWNGESFWINAIFSPVFDTNNKVSKVISLAFDITQNKKLLEETQSQANILQLQEQELRQNMSNLQTAQEEINAKNQAIIQLKEEEALNLQNKNKEIETKNQMITSSINYAQNIQRAILPADDKIRETIQDYFVVYLPKDIVSGDFYWFSRIENRAFFAVVDCTGHGVPGAFMSIIGNTLLNEIVNVQQVFEPHKILELLHLGVRSKLRQGETTNQDGMDVVLCRIDNCLSPEVTLTFSGAKRSLYYYSQKENDLLELKGDRKSIGGWQGEDYRAFTQEQIVLQAGDLIYLTSDGMMDTPNLQRKKYGAKRFREVVLENINRNMKQQKSIMLTEIIEHQQGSEQRDDITIMGVKV